MQSSQVKSLFLLLFLAQGMIVPFLPSWMIAQGISMSAVGLMITFSYLAKTFINPTVGILSDRFPPRSVITLLSAVTGLLYLLSGSSGSSFQLLAIFVLIYFFQPGLYPLCERLAADVSAREDTPYGRFRLWGSIGFAAGGIVFGIASERYGIEHLYVWIAIVYLSASALSGTSITATEYRNPRRLKISALGVSRSHLRFIIPASLIQASNAFLYAFGGISLLSSGWTPFQVSSVWTIGIVFEVLVLALPASVISVLAPHSLIVLAAIASALRWLIFSWTDEIYSIAFAQILQGFTIGLNNVALIRIVNSGAVPAQLRGSTIGAHAALANGLLMGLLILVCNYLYDPFGSKCYILMSIVCLLAAFLARKIRCLPSA